MYIIKVFDIDSSHTFKMYYDLQSGDKFKEKPASVLVRWVTRTASECLRIDSTRFWSCAEAMNIVPPNDVPSVTVLMMVMERAVIM